MGCFFFCSALRLCLKENFIVHEAGWVCAAFMRCFYFLPLFFSFLFDSVAGLGWSSKESEEL